MFDVEVLVLHQFVARIHRISFSPHLQPSFLHHGHEEALPPLAGNPPVIALEARQQAPRLNLAEKQDVSNEDEGVVGI